MNAELARRILLVDDDLAFRLSTAELLQQDGYDIVQAASATEAAEALARDAFDLVLLDLRMPQLDGHRLVEVLRKRGETLPILMISGFGTVESAVEALHLGADDFLTKPVDPDVLSARVSELLERRPTERALVAPIEGIVGRSPAMGRVFEEIRRVAPTDATALITGETGTGKELAARAIHRLSRRSARPFIPVNCSALAEGVLESELFGHKKGAFTGAVGERAGLFTAADGGTIFLDEIGDVGLRLQQRLLRVLQEGEVTPVGAARPLAVDVRVVAATHRDLRTEMEAGRFREDLFYRLNVFHLDLPPLRDRPADVPLLIESALARSRSRLPDSESLSISPFAVRLLRAYDWPGNVRELFAMVESAAIRAGGRRIEAQHLPDVVRPHTDGDSLQPEPGRYASAADADEERAAVLAALEAAGGNRLRAAEILGMSRTTLWRRMRLYDIQPE